MLTPSNQATAGLARVGARAALSFAFAFLKRAWRSGEDSDLCTEVLQEASEILQGLPVALLFDPASVSHVWLEVVDRSMKFLVDLQRRCVLIKGMKFFFVAGLVDSTRSETLFFNEQNGWNFIDIPHTFFQHLC